MSARTFRIHVTADDKQVSIAVEDSGTGIANPEDLFLPFRPGSESTGLGLYVSRSIMRSFGGDLLYKPVPQGCCFVVIVPTVGSSEEFGNA